METSNDGHTNFDRDEARFTRNFHTWMAQQEQDLKQLLEAITTTDDNNNNVASPGDDDRRLQALIATSLKHFEEYAEKRRSLARMGTPSFLFSPTWTSSFENSHMWIAGCRPSIYIRLLYCLCGSGLESQLSDFLQGVRRGNLGELSVWQLRRINELHCKIIAEEDKMTTELASLQESLADQRFVAMATEFWRPTDQASSDDNVRRVLEEQGMALVDVMEKADKLRLDTLREVVERILKPFQAVEFLAAGKKLHLSLHEWCKSRNLNESSSSGLS